MPLRIPTALSKRGKLWGGRLVFADTQPLSAFETMCQCDGPLIRSCYRPNIRRNRRNRVSGAFIGGTLRTGAAARSWGMSPMVGVSSATRRCSVSCSPSPAVTAASRVTSSRRSSMRPATRWSARRRASISASSVWRRYATSERSCSTIVASALGCAVGVASVSRRVSSLTERATSTCFLPSMSVLCRVPRRSRMRTASMLSPNRSAASGTVSASTVSSVSKRDASGSRPGSVMAFASSPAVALRATT